MRLSFSVVGDGAVALRGGLARCGPGSHPASPIGGVPTHPIATRDRAQRLRMDLSVGRGMLSGTKRRAGPDRKAGESLEDPSGRLGAEGNQSGIGSPDDAGSTTSRLDGSARIGAARAREVDPRSRSILALRLDQRASQSVRAGAREGNAGDLRPDTSRSRGRPGARARREADAGSGRERGFGPNTRPRADRRLSSTLTRIAGATNPLVCPRSSLRERARRSHSSPPALTDHAEARDPAAAVQKPPSVTLSIQGVEAARRQEARPLPRALEIGTCARRCRARGAGRPIGRDRGAAAGKRDSDRLAPGAARRRESGSTTASTSLS